MKALLNGALFVAAVFVGIVLAYALFIGFLAFAIAGSVLAPSRRG